MAHDIIHDFTALAVPEDVKGVLIDLDNTCYIYEPCHKKALRASLEMMQEIVGLSYEDLLPVYEKAKKAVKERISTQGASHSRILYFQNMFELLGKGSRPKECVELETVYWDVFMQNMELVRGVRSFLEGCRKKGIKVVIVSDLTTNIQMRKITLLDILHLIDFVVTSEEAGVEKPGADIFALALNKATLDARKVVMIGDSLERDILGAESMGMRGVQIVHEGTH